MYAVACSFCGDHIEGETQTEATMDAHNVGWQKVYPNGEWRCADCLIEEASR